jgi:DNA helicase MCM9
LKGDTLASTYLLTGKDLLIKEKHIRPWKFNQLRLYMNYIKNIVPMLTPDANLVIQKYYQLQRQSDDRNAARTTVRMLESVIRLSQGIIMSL